MWERKKIMDYLQFSWPKKGKKLFVEKGDYHEFSHLGWGDIRTQFYGYITGYKESADRLVEIALSSKDIKTLDTYVFPICFLYRQYLELSIKDLYIKYSTDAKDIKIETLEEVGHDLYKIWNKIKPIIKSYSSDEDFKDASVVESYISQFHSFDKSSFRFRYPISKKFDKTIEQEMRINLKNLKERMHELYCFLDSCDVMIGELKSFEDEMSKVYLEFMDDFSEYY